MNRTRLWGWLFAACVACADDSVADDEAEPVFGTIQSDWVPLPASESFAGKTLAEWGVEYSRWSYAQTSCDSPAFDQKGSLCGLYQDPDSPVFFLDYSPTKRIRTQCRVPRDKAIVVPIITFSNDNAGVDPAFSEEELLHTTLEVLESMRDMKLRSDGNLLTDVDMEERKIAPTRYEYKLPPAPNWYTCNGEDGVEDVTVNPSFFAGYIAVLPPPEPGVHELHYAGVLTWEGDEYALDTRNRFVVGQ